MAKFDTIIKNGVVVTAGDISQVLSLSVLSPMANMDCRQYWIGIKDGKIKSLSETFDEEEMAGAEVIDAEGAYVMPGGVDCHVHLCQDLKTGGQCADDFNTGSLAALCGGTTTIVTFATQTRSDDDKSLLGVVEKYNARAEATGSYIDYGFHVIIVRDDPEVLEDEMPRLVEEWGVTSCKLFMTYESQRLKDRELLDVMVAARKNKVTTMIHAENGDMIEWLTDKLETKGMLAPYYHALSRPPLVEGEATNRAIAMSELVQNPILFVHIGSTLGMNNVRKAQTMGLPIYAETCPQYFNLTWDDLKRFHSPTCFENSKMICSPPPPPDDSDRELLFQGLHNGTFTIFSSDHCPFRYDSPHGKPSGILDHSASMAVEFIPNGIPGVETRLPLLFTGGLLEGRISPQKFVELTATNPAKLYGMYPQKGTLQPGSDADITIWHPQERFSPFQLRNEMLHHNVDYTPYEGQTFNNWPRYVLVRGQLSYAEGAVKGKLRDGRYLKRGPSQLSTGLPGKKDPRRVAGWLYD
ncbi:dihydropyrimidinase [Cryptococcus wingfieldii CBS 7118]|uniref:dihydropyrimidinase n=1 Tax=Cryptococcus wingfieldii CBS 7118 TaxID=1295528 RepID=A0A1E3IVV3_9TREE|nr:dihydropyrimidinase [Cryptococcus wingfieldii CBS 7118]ODN92750.1 dihydropyrimidinase [Cryptococcus wingfieldii CBS 7118]